MTAMDIALAFSQVRAQRDAECAAQRREEQLHARQICAATQEAQQYSARAAAGAAERAEARSSDAGIPDALPRAGTLCGNPELEHLRLRVLDGRIESDHACDGGGTAERRLGDTRGMQHLLVARDRRVPFKYVHQYRELWGTPAELAGRATHAPHAQNILAQLKAGSLSPEEFWLRLAAKPAAEISGVRAQRPLPFLSPDQLTMACILLSRATQSALACFPVRPLARAPRGQNSSRRMEERMRSTPAWAALSGVSRCRWPSGLRRWRQRFQGTRLDSTGR